MHFQIRVGDRHFAKCFLGGLDMSGWGQLDGKRRQKP
jgi:hypothetical protein